MLGPIWKQRRLLGRSVRVELRTQYAGTMLGLIWVALGPLLLLSLYATIYTVIFNVRVPAFSQYEYVLYVFCGLVPFLAFAQSLPASSGAMLKERKLLFSTFPAEFIPTKAVIVAYLIVIPATIFVVIGDIFFSEPTWHLFLVPIVLVMQLLFSIGLGCMLALLTLVVRDINFLLQYVVIALLIVTPIAYTPDMIPGRLETLLYVNPLFYFVSANQHLILLNTLPPPTVMIVGTTLALTFFFGGLFLFRRAKVVLIDLL